MGPDASRLGRAAAEREVKEAEAKLARAHKAMESLVRAHAEAEEAHRALEGAAAARGGSGARGDVEAQLREAGRKVKVADSAAKLKNNQHETEREALAAARAELQKMGESLRTRFPEAPWPPPPPDGAVVPLEKLQKEREKLKRTVASADKALRTSGEVSAAVPALQAALERARRALLDHKELEKCVASTFEAVERAVQERYTHWRKRLHHCAKQCNEDFKRNLTHKGMSGELIFDHVKETLETRVATSSQDRSVRAAPLEPASRAAATAGSRDG